MSGLQTVRKSPLPARAGRFLERHFSGEGIAVRDIVALIIPILVDQAFVVCLTLLNTAMVSTSGVAAVSAVNMVDSLNIFLLQVFIAVATGGTVVVAQYRGSGNEEMVVRSAAQAISAVAILSLVISVLLIIFHGPVLGVLFGKAEEDVMANARVYLIGSCVSYPFIAVVEACCGALRGVAETKSSLGLSLVTNLGYMLLNVLFITVLDLGVRGLVISLIASRLIGMAISLLYLSLYNHTLHFHIRDALKIDPAIQRRIMFIGLPFAAEQMFFNGGKLLTQTFIVGLGTLSLTINAICSSLTNLFQIGSNALNLAVVTVVGQCMGRRDVADARKFVKSFIGLSTCSFILGASVMLPLFHPLVSLFHPPAEIVPTIFTIVAMTAIGQPLLWSMSFITPSALRAAGDSKFTSVVSMCSMWLFRVVMGYVFGITLGFGIIGVWAAMNLEWGVRGLVFMLRFRGEKWHAHHVI